MSDIYGGDPRLILTPAGSDLYYVAGQPVMDQGVENQGLISLFTRRGWIGNGYLTQQEQIGSDFENATEQPISLDALADVANAAELALKSSYFPSPSATVTNPTSDRLGVSIELSPGQVISSDRIGMRWQAQASNPAYQRLT